MAKSAAQDGTLTAGAEPVLWRASPHLSERANLNRAVSLNRPATQTKAVTVRRSASESDQEVIAVPAPWRRNWRRIRDRGAETHHALEEWNTGPNQTQIERVWNDDPRECIPE
jgi:hypothetical protein